MSNITLNVKKKWFDMELSGEKKEEYREIKEFSVTRFLQMDSHLITNGYVCNKLTDAYWYSVGLCGTRLGAVKYLLNTCCSFKKYDTYTALNGMKTLTPTATFECLETKIGTAIPEWSDNFNGSVFIIKLGEIISTKNLNK
jgi:hypothetical protein